MESNGTSLAKEITDIKDGIQYLAHNAFVEVSFIVRIQSPEEVTYRAAKDYLLQRLPSIDESILLPGRRKAIRIREVIVALDDADGVAYCAYCSIKVGYGKIYDLLAALKANKWTVFPEPVEDC